MARITIDLPEIFIFSTNIPVRISDINRGGHVGWNFMFQILDEAYVQFWNGLDYPSKDDETISRITVDAGINYKRQAFHEQTLKVEIGANDFSSKGFDLIFRVTESGEEVARAKAGVLCYDYKTQKVIPIPERLKSKLIPN